MTAAAVAALTSAAACTRVRVRKRGPSGSGNRSVIGEGRSYRGGFAGERRNLAGDLREKARPMNARRRRTGRKVRRDHGSDLNNSGEQKKHRVGAPQQREGKGGKRRTTNGENAQRKTEGSGPSGSEVPRSEQEKDQGFSAAGLAACVSPFRLRSARGSHCHSGFPIFGGNSISTVNPLASS